MHRIQEEVLIISFYTLNSIFLFFPQISISINGTTVSTDGEYIAIIALFSLHLF